MSKMKYVIWAPGYRCDSGGIVVLHRLGEKLQEKGCDVYLHSSNSLPGVPLINHSEFESIKETSWVIYPEIVMGNPLNAKNVIRGVLNTPGYIGGNSATWRESDLVYLITDEFEVDTSILVAGYLRIWDFKLDFWRDEGVDRDINTHLIRKAKGKLGSNNSMKLDKHNEDSLCLDGEIANNFEKLKAYLNRSELFISYDTATYYSTIAALCGAISIIIPDGKHSKDEYRDKSPLRKFGVAWGLDDIQWAIDTKDKVRPHLKEMENEADTLINKFIEDTQ